MSDEYIKGHGIYEDGVRVVDANQIKSIEVDDSSIANGKVLVYDSASGKIVYGDPGGTIVTDAGLPPIYINGNGFAITTGIKGDIVVPFDCTLLSYTILADQAGSIQIDLWKDTYGNFPPTDADSITAAAPVNIPVVSPGVLKNQDTTLTGWTTSLSKGDIIRVNIDSCATIQRVSLHLQAQRS